MKTPITDAVAKQIGKLAALWRSRDINAKQFAEKAQAELNKLGEIEQQRDQLLVRVEDLKEIADWAETLLCNAAPMSHCTQEDWDAVLKRWRDQKHGVKGGSNA